MASHNFNFAGGDILSKIGATWFVSYTYFERIDPNHRNWERVSSRKSSYRSGAQYHEMWLHQVLEMNDRNLERNKIGLSASETKAMARELLANWE